MLNIKLYSISLLQYLIRQPKNYMTRATSNGYRKMFTVEIKNKRGCCIDFFTLESRFLTSRYLARMVEFVCLRGLLKSQ